MTTQRYNPTTGSFTVVNSSLNPQPDAKYLAAFVHAPMLKNLSAKIKQIKAGTADGCIVFCGDSTTAGEATTYRQKLSEVFTTQTATTLQELLGIPVTQDCLTGAHQSAASGNSTWNSYQTTWDPRISIGSTWVTQFYGIGGFQWKFATPASPTDITFTPSNAFDTIRITHITGAAAGSLSIKVNGSVVGTIDATQAATDRIVTYTLTSPVTGTITLTPSSNCTIWINGIFCTNTKRRSLLVVNSGCAGSPITDLCAAPGTFTQSAALTNLSPDLVVVDGGINDLAANVTANTLQTTLTSFLNGLPSTCDKALAIHNDASGLTYPSSYSTAFSTLQSGQGCALMKLNELRWGPLAAASAIGFMAADNIHPNVAGHTDKGLAWANYIFSKV